MSGEKRAAMLAEVSRLRERGVSGELEDAEGDSSMSQQPCRGTVSISSVQLPLKVEFVCSARTRTGTYRQLGYACYHLCSMTFVASFILNHLLCCCLLPR